MIETVMEGTSASMLSAFLVLSLKVNVTTETTETAMMDCFAWIKSAIPNHAPQTASALQETLASAASALLSRTKESHAMGPTRAEETTEMIETAREGTSASVLSALLVPPSKVNVTTKMMETAMMDCFA